METIKGMPRQYILCTAPVVGANGSGHWTTRAYPAIRSPPDFCLHGGGDGGGSKADYGDGEGSGDGRKMSRFCTGLDYHMDRGLEKAEIDLDQEVTWGH